MTPLQLLGYANTVPCSFTVDRASPHCLVSTAFLFRNSLHSHLSTTGGHFAELDVSVPSQGGYYTSSRLRLKSSATCTADVVLGAEWLSLCGVSVAINMLLPPAPERAEGLPEGHKWAMDGKLPPQAKLPP